MRFMIFVIITFIIIIIIMTIIINFSDPATQARIEEMMQAFENSTYIKPSLTTRSSSLYSP